MNTTSSIFRATKKFFDSVKNFTTITQNYHLHNLKKGIELINYKPKIEFNSPSTIERVKKAMDQEKLVAIEKIQLVYTGCHGKVIYHDEYETKYYNVKGLGEVPVTEL